MLAQGEHLSVSGRWSMTWAIRVGYYHHQTNTPPGTHDPWNEIHPAIDVHKT